MLHVAAVGKPQAILSEEDLAIKEANKTGAEISIRPRDGESQRSSRPKKSKRRNATTATNGEIKKSRTKRQSDREMVVPGTTKGMILPFEPLSISFDNISYYVDMPAVSQLSLLQPFNPLR
jgi:hypothetical protein